MNKIKWIGIMLVIALMTGCSSGVDMSQYTDMAPQATAVKVTAVKKDTLKEQFPLPTVLSAKTVETVKAKLSLAPELLVNTGDYVTENQKLLDIDMGYLSSEVKALEMQIASLRLDLEEKQLAYNDFVQTGKFDKLNELTQKVSSAELNYNNQEKTVSINETLYTQGSLSEKDYLQGKIDLSDFKRAYEEAKKAKETYDATGYDFEVAQQKKAIEDIKFNIENTQTDLAEKQKNVSEYRMTSPINGMVISTWSDSDVIGEIKIADNTLLKGEFLVSKGMKAFLEEGQNIDITYEGDQKVPGVIETIGLVPNDAAGQYKVTVAVQNTEQKLRLGEFVYMNVDLKVAKDVMVIPANAIINGTLEDHVFVVENETAVKKVIKTGLKEGDFIEVVEGLAITDQVVVTGQYTLSEGSMVKLVDDVSENN